MTYPWADDADYLEDLQHKLEELKELRASGVAAETIGPLSTSFRSDADLAREIAALEAEIAALQGTTTPRSIVVRSKKGW